MQRLRPHAELGDALRIGLPVNGHSPGDRVSRKPARGAEFGDVAIDAVIEDVLDSLAQALVDQRRRAWRCALLFSKPRTWAATSFISSVRMRLVAQVVQQGRAG